jgi:hypothetical protein
MDAATLDALIYSKQRLRDPRFSTATEGNRSKVGSFFFLCRATFAPVPHLTVGLCSLCQCAVAEALNVVGMELLQLQHAQHTPCAADQPSSKRSKLWGNTSSIPQTEPTFADLPVHLQTRILALAGACLLTCKASALIGQEAELIAEWFCNRDNTDSPLSIAAEYERWDVVHLLLDKGVRDGVHSWFLDKVGEAILYHACCGLHLHPAPTCSLDRCTEPDARLWDCLVVHNK